MIWVDPVVVFPELLCLRIPRSVNTDKLAPHDLQIFHIPDGNVTLEVGRALLDATDDYFPIIPGGF
jgi:hypothetical protein